jgi:hypothetical protein
MIVIGSFHQQAKNLEKPWFPQYFEVFWIRIQIWSGPHNFAVSGSGSRSASRAYRIDINSKKFHFIQKISFYPYCPKHFARKEGWISLFKFIQIWSEKKMRSLPVWVIHADLSIFFLNFSNIQTALSYRYLRITLSYLLVFFPSLFSIRKTTYSLWNFEILCLFYVPYHAVPSVADPNPQDPYLCFWSSWIRIQIH